MFSEFILPGVLIGIAAAVSPGPLLLLAISETFRGGLRSGLLVTISPLITDIPFVLVSILLAKEIGAFAPVVGALSLGGAGFLVFLAYQNFSFRPEDLMRPSQANASLLKGVITNLLNPYLYIFWFSVALPVFSKGNFQGSVLFAVALLFASVASLMILVMLAAFARKHFLDYITWALRALSVCLLLVALMFVRDGISLLSGALQ